MRLCWCWNGIIVTFCNSHTVVVIGWSWVHFITLLCIFSVTVGCWQWIYKLWINDLWEPQHGLLWSLQLSFFFLIVYSAGSCGYMFRYVTWPYFLFKALWVCIPELNSRAVSIMFFPRWAHCLGESPLAFRCSATKINLRTYCELHTN